MFPDSWAPVVTSDSPRVGNMGRSLGTRCMSLLSSSPSLWVFLVTRVTGLKTPRTHSLEMKEREDVCLETDPCIWNPWTLLDINSRPRGNPAVNVQERRVQRDSHLWFPAPDLQELSSGRPYSFVFAGQCGRVLEGQVGERFSRENPEVTLKRGRLS